MKEEEHCEAGMDEEGVSGILRTANIAYLLGAGEFRPVDEHNGGRRGTSGSGAADVLENLAVRSMGRGAGRAAIGGQGVSQVGII